MTASERAGVAGADAVGADAVGTSDVWHAPAEYALLGLLREGPAHGYALAEAFGPRGRLGFILRLRMSQLYAYLRKLERQDWVRVEQGEHGAMGGRARHVFALAPAGGEAFAAWLGAPVAATRDVRVAFLLKLALLRDDTPAARALIARQRAATVTWLERLRVQAAAVARAPSPDGPLRALVLRHRVRQSEATLAWLDEARDALGAP